MGIAADSLFNVLMSWVRALVSAIWALFSADSTTALEFLGKNWMIIAAVIIVCGLVIDWIIWLIRWQPYHLWARRLRRLLRLDEPEEEDVKVKSRAHAAVLPENRYARPESAEPDEPDEETPLYLHSLEDEDEQEWLDRADEVPDEELSAYPGMRYGSAHKDAEPYAESRSMLTQEGPGAAEVARRRAEIDAWQLQMQEEARARAEAEKAEREAQEAEQARLAQEAYEAEQARLAQEEYARQMEEYERQKAQYALDLAEYERQKAEYEAQLAAQEAYEAQQQETPSAAGTPHRRRVAANSAEELDATRVQMPVRAAASEVKRDKPKTKSAAPAKVQKKNAEPKADKSNGLFHRMAQMIEPEEEEIISRKTLPPRVDMNDAFRTAKLPVVTPPKNGRRKK